MSVPDVRERSSCSVWGRKVVAVLLRGVWRVVWSSLVFFVCCVSVRVDWRWWTDDDRCDSYACVLALILGEENAIYRHQHATAGRQTDGQTDK